MRPASSCDMRTGSASLHREISGVSIRRRAAATSLALLFVCTLVMGVFRVRDYEHREAPCSSLTDPFEVSIAVLIQPAGAVRRESFALLRENVNGPEEVRRQF